MICTAEFTDLSGVRALDCLTLPKEWHVPISFYEKTYLQSPGVFRVFKEEERIIGYYSLFPLHEQDFNALMNGEITEQRVPKLVRPLEKEGEPIFMYFGSLIIHPEYPRKLRASSKLIEDVSRHLADIFEEAYPVRELGTFCVSQEGMLVAKRFGMQYVQELDRGVMVFRASADQLRPRHKAQVLS